ncbi:YchJ family protein [Rosenbergiella australiborealis]|uniref:YchJ family protein n=1 Tax=Rosenbergiella australiborealis TaxID=1544696 RepID=A0ABS5T1W2_9GAMM|nr:YchJ family protein [Rosenbergiella australiborealis]MBT0726323.1 YchJ family protein [Rosenbergiella australiborealis]
MPCPCGSLEPFEQCCHPFLKGERHASTAEQLMRSRYTAYSQSNVRYIVNTWHSTTRPENLAALLEQDSDSTQWLGLSVNSSHQGKGADEAYVTFFARYITGQQRAWIYETSRFIRENNHWYYIDGVHKIPGRNDTCPCGSQKKFKKCCAN